jgi:hypothetical protein
MQHGGGKCSKCGSEGTNKVTCPLNPLAVNKDFMKHSNAASMLAESNTVTHYKKTRSKTDLSTKTEKTLHMASASEDPCSFRSEELCLDKKVENRDFDLFKIDKDPTTGDYIYDGEILPIQQMFSLGKGSFGTVTGYTIGLDNDPRKTISFASKMSLEYGLDEYKALKLYPNLSRVCQTCIPFKVLSKKEAIMPLAHGSLIKLLPFNVPNALKVLQCIRKSLQLMSSIGVFYLDIKASNIMFICKNDNIQFYLGDIGTVVPQHIFTETGKKIKIYGVTFPPRGFENGAVPVEYAKKNYSNMYTYLLIILFCELLYPLSLIPTFTASDQKHVNMLDNLANLLEKDHPPFAKVFKEYIDEGRITTSYDNLDLGLKK